MLFILLFMFFFSVPLGNHLKKNISRERLQNHEFVYIYIYKMECKHILLAFASARKIFVRFLDYIFFFMSAFSPLGGRIQSTCWLFSTPSCTRWYDTPMSVWCACDKRISAESLVDLVQQTFTDESSFGPWWSRVAEVFSSFPVTPQDIVFSSQCPESLQTVAGSIKIYYNTLHTQEPVWSQKTLLRCVDSFQAINQHNKFIGHFCSARMQSRHNYLHCIIAGDHERTHYSLNDSLPITWRSFYCFINDTSFLKWH